MRSIRTFFHLCFTFPYTMSESADPIFITLPGMVCFPIHSGLAVSWWYNSISFVFDCFQPLCINHSSRSISLTNKIIYGFKVQSHIVFVLSFSKRKVINCGTALSCMVGLSPRKSQISQKSLRELL